MCFYFRLPALAASFWGMLDMKRQLNLRISCLKFIILGISCFTDCIWTGWGAILWHYRNVLVGLTILKKTCYLPGMPKGERRHRGDVKFQWDVELPTSWADHHQSQPGCLYRRTPRSGPFIVADDSPFDFQPINVLVNFVRLAWLKFCSQLDYIYYYINYNSSSLSSQYAVLLLAYFCTTSNTNSFSNSLFRTTIACITVVLSGRSMANLRPFMRKVF